jgi:hypothetical protein
MGAGMRGWVKYELCGKMDGWVLEVSRINKIQ